MDVDSDIRSVTPAAMELSSLSGDIEEWAALDQYEPRPQGEEAGIEEDTGRTQLEMQSDDSGQTPRQTEMAAAEAADFKQLHLEGRTTTERNQTQNYFHGEIEQEADAEKAEQERMARETAERAEQERHPTRPVTQIDFTALQQDPLAPENRRDSRYRAKASAAYVRDSKHWVYFW